MAIKKKKKKKNTFAEVNVMNISAKFQLYAPYPVRTKKCCYSLPLPTDAICEIL